jgi:hypothetical protein
MGRGHEHHAFAHPNERRAGGLPGHFAHFKRNLFIADLNLKRSSFDMGFLL